MNVQYDIPKLEAIITSLSRLTGISMSFIRPDGEVVCWSAPPKPCFCSLGMSRGAFSEKTCEESDREIMAACARSRRVEGHLCHAGLYDAAMPIVLGDTLVGFVMFGQFRTPTSVPCEAYMADPVLRATWEEIPLYDEEQIESLKFLLPHVLVGNAVRMEYSPFATELSEYVAGHLGEDLGVEALCARFSVSKNTLYRAVRENFDTTVNEFVTSRRLERACQLLTGSDTPVVAIAESVGLGNYPYFCRLFRQRLGKTPGEYRRGEQG